MSLLLPHPTTVGGAGQANMSPPHHFRNITVRGKILSSVSPLPNTFHQTSNNIVPTISTENTVPTGKKGKYAFIILGFCFALRQAYNLGKGSVNSKLDSRETITATKGGEKILRAGNKGGSCENVVCDQNNNNRGASGYLRIVAVKGVVGMEKMGSGRKTLDACGVILSQSVAGAEEANNTLPKSTCSAPSPPSHRLRDITVRINIPPPPNYGAPPSIVPLLHHHPTTLANNTLPKYTPTPPLPTHHVRDSSSPRVGINIHPSVPPLPNSLHQLSEATGPLHSNNSSSPC
ncbi:hypothetical protein SUGI_0101940 [Cryptomeria japonica]|nr:hypothetical protein SUGI_0101940 [Cryptomeria japonica]